MPQRSAAKGAAAVRRCEGAPSWDASTRQSVARDYDHIEGLVQLDVVLAAEAFGIVHFVDARHLGSCSILPPEQPQTFRPLGSSRPRRV
jgi:hypothetical protein